MNFTKDIVLLAGFAGQEARQALAALAAAGHDTSNLTAAPLTDGALDKATRDCLTETQEGRMLPGKPITTGDRAVLMMTGHDKARAVALMQAFRSVAPADADTVFAMVTETALDWTIAYYMDHVRKEHEYMKTHSPEGDPDMKAVED